MASSCEAVAYKVGKESSSLMRVGQSRHMTRAEKRAIECFVSTTDVQILQSILDFIHTAGVTNRSKLSFMFVSVLVIEIRKSNQNKIKNS